MIPQRIVQFINVDSLYHILSNIFFYYFYLFENILPTDYDGWWLFLPFDLITLFLIWNSTCKNKALVLKLMAGLLFF